MKKIAIIGASYLQKPLVEKAKSLGLETYVFAWEQGAVCKEIASKFYPISILEKEQILNICESLKIDGIVSIASDAAMPTIAYVAENLGLISNSSYTTLLTTNKYLMKEELTKYGIRCPAYTQVEVEFEIEKIISQINFPCIVKPTDRSGSKGVCIVKEKEKLISAIKQSQVDSFEKRCLIESYVEGFEISVEMISWEGRHYLLAVTDKTTTGPPHFVETGHRQPSALDKVLLLEVQNIVEKALTILNIKYGASHTELLITKERSIYVNEVAARMGGDFIGSSLVKLSTGYDFLEGVVNVSLGKFEEPKLVQNQKAGIIFLSKENKMNFNVLEKSNINIIQKEIFNSNPISLTSSADRSGYIIYHEP